MSYATATAPEQDHLRDYVESMLERFWAMRESKENLAIAALAVFLGAVATALVSKDWPPEVAEGRPVLTLAVFAIVWVLYAVYARYQLRRRRWASLRVSGCEWLLAEWLPGSPRAMATKGDPHPLHEPSRMLLFLDTFVWPLKRSVNVLKPSLHVYPKEIEQAWIWAQERGSDALIHERIVHVMSVLAYFAVLVRTVLAR